MTHINHIEIYDICTYMTIDVNSRRNLELVENIRDKGKTGTLLWVIDKTNTSMGGRRIRKWLEEPLIIKKDILNRQDAIEEFTKDIILMEDLKEALNSIYDIERLVGKISSTAINAKELISLKHSIAKVPRIKELISKLTSPLMKEVYSSLDELRDIWTFLESSIMDEPSLSVKEGNIIKTGYNSLVDELRESKTNGKLWLANLENEERIATGIKSLKISYNKVFGYYIEVTKSNLSSVPEGRYIRKQTLSNAERYITPELKEMEDKILGAEEKLIALEYSIFTEIRKANSFISNDTTLDLEDNRLMLITGPNMAGKSTYMRQVALITLLAQMGSFVPAKEANVSICDKIFTRIGASDDLAGGKSTFMVEMWEVSNILNNATNKSLVLLDEVGRGTSTYDGLSIAWAVIEYICKNSNIKCKTLFATHYHELTKLEGEIPGVKNYSISAKKVDNNIIFLRKIIKGGADESYGIEVAKLAGLPSAVISRAREILETLEDGTSKDIIKEEVKTVIPSTEKLEKIEKEICLTQQLAFEDVEMQNLIDEIKSIDGFNKLYDIIKKAKNI